MDRRCSRKAHEVIERRFLAGNPMGTDWMMTADDVAEAALFALSVSDRVELPELWLRCRKK